MTNLKTTKRALLSSVVALLVCFTMLLGTTFAWFTDSVTSSGNIIQSGTLEIGMYWAEGDEAVPTDANGWKDASKGAIFNNSNWEPGYVEAKHIKIANEGSLALKYKLLIVPNGEVEALADVIDVYFIKGATQITSRDELANLTPVGTLRDMIEDKDGAAYGALLPTTATETANENEEIGEVTATIAFKMREEAGNQYQGMKIGADFAIQLIATQYTYEEDSFNNQYDSAADYPNVSNTVALNTTSTDGVKLATTGDKAVTANVSATLVQSLATAGIESIALCHSEPKVDATTGAVTFDSVEIVDQDGQIIDLSTYDGSLTITLPVKEIENGTVVEIYHDGELVASNVAVHDGTITYDVAHLCAITVKKSVIKLPTAEVVELTEDERTITNDDMQQGYEVTQTLVLDYGLKLSTTEAAEAAAASGYAKWHADFVITFDKDVTNYDVALAGRYGNYGWIPVFLPDGNMPTSNEMKTVTAGTEIRVLEDLLSNKMNKVITVNYEELSEIEHFICGIVNMESQTLPGTTVTVELRLYEVEEPSADNNHSSNVETGNYYTVTTSTYTFD